MSRMIFLLMMVVVVSRVSEKLCSENNKIKVSLHHTSEGVRSSGSTMTAIEITTSSLSYNDSDNKWWDLDTEK